MRPDSSRSLHVLSVGDRRLIGSIELSESGELRMTPRGVQGVVETMAKSRGWNPREAFEHLNGWSNGYLRIVRADG